MSNQYGHTTFVSFLGTILSRLSYFDDKDFSRNYTDIMNLFPRNIN